MRSRVTAGLALAMVTGSVLLSGCDSFGADPVMFTLVNGQIVARSCIPMTIGSVTVSGRGGTFEATGDLELEAGSEFLLLAPPGMTVSRSETIDPAGQTEVTIPVVRSGGGSWEMTAFLEPGVLTEGSWTDTWGETRTPPCAENECAPGFACHNQWPADEDAQLPDATLTPTPLPSPTETQSPAFTPDPVAPLGS